MEVTFSEGGRYKFACYRLAYKELESRADYLKTNGHWDEVLDVYLEKKNSNDNPDKHSRSLYAETINECFSRYCNHK